MNGKFISLEGVEGSGKTLQAHLLYSYLKKSNYKTVQTAEPGSTYMGRTIRKILLNPKNSSLTHTTELFLYLADRSQHTAEVIIPKLKKNYIVICDRFIDATLAYQGAGRMISLSLIHRLNNLATSRIKPDLTILLDISPTIGLRRAVTVGPYKGDRMERQVLAFHRRVRKGYLALAKKEPNRIKIVNAKGSIKEIHNEIIKLANTLLKSNFKLKDTNS